MRVAYITRGPFGVLGGAASYMIPTYMEKYADVLVLSLELPGSKEKIVYHNDGLEKYNIFAISEKEVLFNTYRRLVALEPDIVHIFQSPNCLLYLSGLCHLFPKTKWVLDIRTQLITKKKSLRKFMIKKFFLSQFYADHIFSQSKHTIHSSLPIRLKSFTELPIGLDLSNFNGHQSIEMKNKKPLRFLFVGLLATEREIEVLLKAFGHFQKTNNIPITLDVIGDGTAKIKLQELVIEQQVSGVKFCGAMSQKKVHELVADYDCGIAYVPYGSYKWAPSLKSIEYAAGGIPILASDTNGHKDYEKRFGFKFNFFKNSVESISGALKEICARNHFDDEIRHNRKMVKRFHWDYIVKNDVIPIYQKLILNK